MNHGKSPRPNILLICVDHWPGELLGAAGHEAILTPTLDRLARNGVRYRNAYAETPMCIPARRALMTGTTARTHGDRNFSERLAMPGLPTLASSFRDAGYQACAVGKMHVFPPRDRIGFDDVILHEEGRRHVGLRGDDYERYLAESGLVGQEFAHGISSNDYMTRTWHLPEAFHPTNWAVREMCRTIRRRDPTRPGLWYLSFTGPHPPLVPPAEYLDVYRDVAAPRAAVGAWARNFDDLPYALKLRSDRWPGLSDRALELALQAFYATCTHIDHQIAVVMGTLREEGLLDDTVVCFTSDHGDMLGLHGQFAKSLFYERSARIPLLVVPTAAYDRLGHGQVDERLAELRDIMPTLLELAGLPIPGGVEGISLLSSEVRSRLYGEAYEDERASRMLRDERFKLVYYPVGNHRQLFDLAADPDERVDLAAEPGHAGTLQRLTDDLIDHLYGQDLDWLEGGRLVGLPDRAFRSSPRRDLNNQRGWR